MALWRLYYHLVWATKGREPLIAAAQESALYRYMIGKADAMKCIVHAVNGTADHVHLVASIPPSLSISEFVKNIKGSSAHYFNHDLSAMAGSFAWQAGYGVFSLGYKQLEKAISYVEGQKEHHAHKTTILSLEEMTNDDDAPRRYYLPDRSPDRLPGCSPNCSPNCSPDRPPGN